MSDTKMVESVSIVDPAELATLRADLKKAQEEGERMRKWWYEQDQKNRALVAENKQLRAVVDALGGALVTAKEARA